MPREDAASPVRQRQHPSSALIMATPSPLHRRSRVSAQDQLALARNVIPSLPMAIDVVVIGGISSDYAILGDDLPQPGEHPTGKTFHEGHGGKGANQAIAAARLG